LKSNREAIRMYIPCHN